MSSSNHTSVRRRAAIACLLSTAFRPDEKVLRETPKLAIAIQRIRTAGLTGYRRLASAPGSFGHTAMTRHAEQLRGLVQKLPSADHTPVVVAIVRELLDGAPSYTLKLDLLVREVSQLVGHAPAEEHRQHALRIIVEAGLSLVPERGEAATP